jgi:hypothetical protein
LVHADFAAAPLNIALITCCAALLAAKLAPSLTPPPPPLLGSIHGGPPPPTPPPPPPAASAVTVASTVIDAVMSALPLSVTPAEVAALRTAGDTAATKANSDLETTEGKSKFLQDLIYYGPNTISHVQHDSAARAWMAADRATKGGAVFNFQHCASEAAFKEFWQDVTDACLKANLNGAVARIQMWFAKAPPWHAGGRKYMLAYLKKHHCTLPVRVDRDLRDACTSEMFQAVGEQIASFEGLDGVLVSMHEMQSEILSLRNAIKHPPTTTAYHHVPAPPASTVPPAAVASSSSNTFPGSFDSESQELCTSCMGVGHNATQCTLSKQQQDRTRIAFYKQKKVSEKMAIAARQLRANREKEEAAAEADGTDG